MHTQNVKLFLYPMQ